MTDKEHFIHEWLKDNPNDDRSDAVDAWKGEVKFLKQFYDWGRTLMTDQEFDQLFDNGESILKTLDLSTARRINHPEDTND